MKVPYGKKIMANATDLKMMIFKSCNFLQEPTELFNVDEIYHEIKNSIANEK